MYKRFYFDLDLESLEEKITILIQESIDSRSAFWNDKLHTVANIFKSFF